MSAIGGRDFGAVAYLAGVNAGTRHLAAPGRGCPRLGPRQPVPESARKGYV
jgi:hypothetical protein